MSEKISVSPGSIGMAVADPCASTDLIPVAEAVTRILQQGKRVVETETVSVENALNRWLAEDVIAGIDVPGYDNSAMDGYAVRSTEIQPGVCLPVSQRIPAGSVGEALQVGTVARIFTGAPIPVGADAVVMQEDCVSGEAQTSDGDTTVTINTAVKAGMNVRRAGEDIAKQSVILHKGKQLRPQEMGLLASVGVSQVSVFRRLKVAIFFTGDELVKPGQPLSDGQIYNSNKYTLTGFLQGLGCDLVDLGIVPDTLNDTLAVLQSAAEQADLVITSGGVSVGEEDYVRIALQQLGQLSMWRIAMKPGKPVAFGTVGETLFMGLPGNPVSVFVTAILFARPLILKCQGAAPSAVLSSRLQVKAGFDWCAGQRQEYIRVKLEPGEEGAVARLFPHQGSGVLSSASWADGLVEVMTGRSIREGDRVSYLPFQGLLG